MTPPDDVSDDVDLRLWRLTPERLRAYADADPEAGDAPDPTERRIIRACASRIEELEAMTMVDADVPDDLNEMLAEMSTNDIEKVRNKLSKSRWPAFESDAPRLAMRLARWLETYMYDFEGGADD